MGPGYRLEGFFLLFVPQWRINKQHLQRAFVRKLTTCRYYHEITFSACFVFVVNFKNAATFNDVVNKIGLALAYRRFVAVVCFNKHKLRFATDFNTRKYLAFNPNFVERIGERFMNHMQIVSVSDCCRRALKIQ